MTITGNKLTHEFKFSIEDVVRFTEPLTKEVVVGTIMSRVIRMIEYKCTDGKVMVLFEEEYNVLNSMSDELHQDIPESDIKLVLKAGVFN
jgi:late competence protein required for DNA uptake (superfamily II DNA/RNA helicase)